MGEVALRRNQSGIEATRGTAVAATKKLYGVAGVTLAQPNIYAQDDRGNFIDKWRGNPKTVDAGLSFDADALFEDLPYYLEMLLQGGISPSGTSSTGYTWKYVPDQTSDLLKTRTWETGDNAIAWQGPFATFDQGDFTLGLDDTTKVKFTGWVQNWIPQTSGSLTTTFAGFTGGLPDRSVEAVSGYLNKLYIDVPGTAPGTTQVIGRFISATWSYHNQNSRKYFGDGSAVFTGLGRGRRQVQLDLTFEGSADDQFATWVGHKELVVRLAETGFGIAGSVGPVYKQQLYDFWGLYDTHDIGARDTNTTFQMTLMATYDFTSAEEACVTVINQQAAL